MMHWSDTLCGCGKPESSTRPPKRSHTGLCGAPPAGLCGAQGFVAHGLCGARGFVAHLLPSAACSLRTICPCAPVWMQSTGKDLQLPNDMPSILMACAAELAQKCGSAPQVPQTQLTPPRLNSCWGAARSLCTARHCQVLHAGFVLHLRAPARRPPLCACQAPPA